ncbi:MAG: methyltransferase domain-containing protein [Planctomycetota bacterium]|nr:MAG: methyltransferase domain-containing protein [Planctomycetota bacterium]
MNATVIDEELRGYLREYYGRRLQHNGDLTEQACCTDATAARHADTIALLPDEVVRRHYGCGCPLPEDDLSGLTCLDLGSGAGVDAFILSRLVGPEGHVHGIDMTLEQLEVARKHAPAVARAFGFERPNTTFHEGFIETAEAIADASIDLVISDCVINLSPRKDLVIETIARVLREGGELYVSDIVADRRVPESLASDPRLVAECLGGALYLHDFLDLLRDAGFGDPRIVESRVLQTDVAGEPIEFRSVTVRAQKFAQPLDRRCEDYGQLATYTGAFPRCPARFRYDDHHVFERGRPTPVCRNTARMLSETRLAKGFQVTPPLRHFGLFDCAPRPVASDAEACC